LVDRTHQQQLAAQINYTALAADPDRKDTR
jgi:hypothetical protein